LKGRDIGRLIAHASLIERPFRAFELSGGEEMLDRGADLPRDRLLRLVKEILAKNSITRLFAIEDPLAEVGLTSIDMVNLMLAVEAEFDIVIPASEITPANFRTILSIEALIVKMHPKTTGP
jgi:acyl carrier protein